MKKLILTLHLTSAGRANRIDAIKGLRTATGWGLKESKDVVDALHGTLSCQRRVVMFAEHVAMLNWGLTMSQSVCWDLRDVEAYNLPDVMDLTAQGTHLGPQLQRVA
jgi:hypothetical protein